MSLETEARAARETAQRAAAERSVKDCLRLIRKILGVKWRNAAMGNYSNGYVYIEGFEFRPGNDCLYVRLNDRSVMFSSFAELGAVIDDAKHYADMIKGKSLGDF